MIECAVPDCPNTVAPSSLFCWQHREMRAAVSVSNVPLNSQPRTFDTGATRDTDTDKPDYEGFLSPLVTERFGEYMIKHRKQADGTLRDSDNWQKGIPLAVYAKSAWRHFLDFWKLHRGFPLTPGRRTSWSGGGERETQDLEEVLCALLFNVQGYLHETIKARTEKVPIDARAGQVISYDPRDGVPRG